MTARARGRRGRRGSVVGKGGDGARRNGGARRARARAGGEDGRRRTWAIEVRELHEDSCDGGNREARLAEGVESLEGLVERPRFHGLLLLGEES